MVSESICSKTGAISNGNAPILSTGRRRRTSSVL